MTGQRRPQTVADAPWYIAVLVTVMLFICTVLLCYIAQEVGKIELHTRPAPSASPSPR